MNPAWSTLVMSRAHLRPWSRADETNRGQAAHGRDVTLYGMWDSMGKGRDIYAEATLHRAISDLTPLLQRSRTDVLLAGDLNVYRNWQHGSPEGDRLWAGR